jgi:hypothetical protein
MVPANQRENCSPKESLNMQRARTLFFCLCCVVAPSLLHAQEPALDTSIGPVSPTVTAKAMTNDSIVRMVKAGLGEDLILQTIRTQPGRYATDVDSLLALKEAGVSERVISGMIDKGRVQITPEKPVVLSDVNEIGVYYKDHDGRWQPIDAEIVHVKSGGFIKSTITHGIIKEDRNGHINGRESKLLLPRSTQFLIYTPDGVDVAEYDFLRFRLNADNREFRTLTGGVFHSTGGAERDEVPFKPVRTAPHTYEFTVDKDLRGGEYGILPPGTGNVTNGGKIYTFAITEEPAK